MLIEAGTRDQIELAALVAFVAVMGGAALAGRAGGVAAVRKVPAGLRSAIAIVVLVILIGCPVIGLGFHFFSRDVIVVEDSGRGARAARMVELGEWHDTTKVVNHSHLELRLEEVTYSKYAMGSGLSPVSTPVAAGTEEEFSYPIEDVGPGHRPPSSIESKSDSETRHWLTW